MVPHRQRGRWGSTYARCVGERGKRKMVTLEKAHSVYLYRSVEADAPVLAALFGELLRLVIPLVQHYHSDLWHDAMWLQRHITAGASFYISARTSGTSIGTDRDLVRYASEKMWKITVERDGTHCWFAHVTPMATR